MTNRFDITLDRPITQPILPDIDIFGVQTTTPAIPQSPGVERIPGIIEETKMKAQKKVADFLGVPTPDELRKTDPELANAFDMANNLVLGFAGRDLTKVVKLKAADTALSKLISVIKQAKPLRGEVEKAASAERSLRAGKAAGVLEKVQGEKAFIQAKGQLKGPLIPEKPIFEISREKLPKIKPTKIVNETKISDLEEFIAIKEQNLIDSPAKQLTKYANKNQELPEVLGGVHQGVGAKSIFGIRGDDIVTELGFADSEEARAAYSSYVKAKETLGKLKEELKNVKKGTLIDYTPEQLEKINQLSDEASKNIEGILRKELNQADIDTLFIQIQKHPDLSVYEKISAADGFGQLLGGEIPQPSKLSLLEDIFGKELIKETLAKRGGLDKLKDLTTEILNIPRSLIASFDMSAPLRQGILFTTTKPKSALKAGYQMFRQAFSEKNYVSWLDNIKKDPVYRLMKDSNLYIADPRRVSGGLAAREERFMSNLAEKIPIIGRGVKAAERAYTSYLNKLRVDVFTNMVNKFQKMGLEPKANEELYKSVAGFVNNATGRGDLGKLNRNAQILNNLFFSPRLIASRFNLLNPVWYAKQPPLLRKEAVKAFAEFVGVGSTVLTLAKMGGADVEIDPRSTDFGKIRIGNTRWDIWGGFQQWVRVFSQLALGARKTQKGDIIPLSRKKFPFETRLDVVERFFRGKLAPVPSLALELFEGSKLFGEEIKFTQEIAENTMPLYLQDIKEAFDQLGPSAMFTVGAPAFFGVGVQTYEEKQKVNRFNF